MPEDLSLQDEERGLIEDLTSMNGLMNTVIQSSAQGQEQAELTYGTLLPAIQKASRGSAPDRYDPSYVESALVYSNGIGDRISELRQLRQQATTENSSRVGQPFDPNNPVDAQFLDENGVPSFNNDNYKDFLRSRDVPEEMINELDSRSGPGIIEDLAKMRPEERVATIQMMAKIAKDDADARQKAIENDGFRLTDANLTKAQEELKNAGDNILELGEIESLTDDRYLTLVGRAEAELTTQAEKLGLSDEEAKQFVTQRNEWFGRIKVFFNKYRKETTGVAFSEKEMKDLEEAVINGKMSASQFKGILNAMRNNLELVSEIRAQMIDEQRVFTLPELRKRLEASGRVATIPGTKAHVSKPFSGMTDKQISDKLVTAELNNNASDASYLQAIKEINDRATQDKSKKWINLPEAKRKQLLDGYRNIIRQRVNK